jgi:hypothetical protein
MTIRSRVLPQFQVFRAKPRSARIKKTQSAQGSATPPLVEVAVIARMEKRLVLTEEWRRGFKLRLHDEARYVAM